MSSAVLWNNLLAYSAQVLALVAAGALLPVLFRVRQPRAQLVTCQLLLAVNLILPALQPWRRPLIVVPEGPATTAAAVTSPLPATQPASPRIRLEDAVLWVLAAGVAVRVLWLLVGLWRLHRYRLGATPLYPLPAAIESARVQTGAEAIVCVSAAVDNPVTFGFLPPVILLPPALLEQPFEQQFAVASHEFLHVRRHDWLLTIGEELAGALVWFHPAVWWLQSQIRLAREQVVDRQVVALTEARDPYVSALLAMAGARLRLDLAPAPLFLRKRHLANRIHSLLKEVSVSKRRLISSYASIAAILVLTAWLVAASFPLSGSPQVEVQQRGVVDQAGISVQPGGTLLHRTPLRYPAEALQNKIEGVVVVSLNLNADGTVSDARILSGPDELRRTVLESVLQWHYLREASGVVQATIEFRLPEAQLSPGFQLSGGVFRVGGGVTAPTLISKVEPEYSEEARAAKFQGIVLLYLEVNGQGLPQNVRVIRALGMGLDEKAIEAVMKWRFRPGEKDGKPVTVATQVEINFRLPPSPPQQAESGTPPILVRIDVSNLPEPLQGMMKSRLAPFEGQPDSIELLSQIREAAREVDSHAQIMSHRQEAGKGATLAIGLPGSTPTSAAANFPSTPGMPRIRVAGGIQTAMLISQTAPVYPPLARQARIQGLVRFNAVIGRDGKVQNLTLVQGHPLLVPAAQEAVRGYVYQPTLLNGEPVEVVTQIEVNFTLEQTPDTMPLL